jgi:hypothetical protein
VAVKNHSEHARVTAICVNLALDAAEADLADELTRVKGDAAVALERVLTRVRQRRIVSQELEPAGSC